MAKHAVAKATSCSPRVLPAEAAIVKPRELAPAVTLLLLQAQRDTQLATNRSVIAVDQLPADGARVGEAADVSS
jgi:hypothetical protein